MRIKTVEEMTFEALKEKPWTREDDFLLYGSVLKRCGFDLNMTLAEFLKNAKKIDAPALESVPRARREIFKNYPELQPLETKLKREEKEREYLRYSRGDN